MDSCCQDKQTELRSLASQQRAVLKIALLINFSMFLIEGIYGIIADSTSLLADSLDMFGDSLVYAFSLFVVGRSATSNASVAILKGSVMAAFGVGVILQAIYRFSSPVLPHVELMGVVGGLALLANLTSAYLLLRHRDDDLNMRSTWLCSRNDVIANIAVLIAAWAVQATQTRYPDLIVGFLIAVLFLKSAFTVLKESFLVYRGSKTLL